MRTAAYIALGLVAVIVIYLVFFRKKTTPPPGSRNDAPNMTGQIDPDPVVSVNPDLDFTDELNQPVTIPGRTL